MKDRNAPVRDKSGFFKVGIIVLAAAIIVMAVMLFMPGDTEPVRPAEESVSTETESTGGNKDKWAEGVVTYNGKNWFANVYGQLHRFSYNHDNTSVKMWDWYVNTQFGIRF